MKFICHLGLGDAIILSGAVEYLSRDTDIIFPCWNRYIGSVQSFFVENPRVSVYGVEMESDMGEEGLRSGYYSTPYLPGESLDQWFYRQMNIPFIERWSSCPIKRASLLHHQIPVPDKPYIFIHEDEYRPIVRLDRSRTVSYPPVKFHTILECADLVENAEEVHVIPSSFKPFVDSLNPKGKLFLHWYARPYGNRDLDIAKSRYDWSILE